MPKAATTVSNPRDESTPVRTWLMLTVLGIAAAALLARDSRGDRALPAALVALLQLPLVFTWVRTRWQARGGSKRAAGDLAAAAVVTVAGIGIGAAMQSLDAALVSITGFMAGTTGLNAIGRLYQRIEQAIDSPVRLLRVIAPPWLACTLVAGVLLALPLATQPGVPDYRHNFVSHVVSSLHAAVSTACLVGTFTFSFSTDFTRFGQFVIILLTQLSGFAFAAIGLSLIRPVLQRAPTLRQLFATAAVAQLIGIAVLFTAWRPDDAPSVVDRVWWGLVHAGSALWNTDILLRGDGLVRYFADRRVFLTITTLAIAGSLGIPILFELLRKRPPADSSTFRPTGRLGAIPTFDAFSAFVLLLFMSAALFYFEHPASVLGQWRPALPFEPSVNQPAMTDNRASPWPLAVLVAATARSAGLQTIPISIGTLSWPSYGLLLSAMMVGGSIAGTAGGIRTSLFALLLLAPGVRKTGMIQRKGKTQSLRRYLLGRFIIGLSVWLLLSGLGVMLLGMTTNAARYDTTFDAVAAIGNVGLTTGLAAHLTVAGRLVSAVLMVTGRWWPLLFWAKTIAVVQTGTNTADAQT